MDFSHRLKLWWRSLENWASTLYEVAPAMNDSYLKTLQIYEWNLPEPQDRLRTKEDYDRTFSRNLIGTWSNDDAMMPNPMTQDVVFRGDGTGAIQGTFFTAYSGTFEWREVGERLIEIRATGESEPWTHVRWEFGGDWPVLLLDSGSEDEGEETTETPQLIIELTLDPLVLTDSRAWKETSFPDPAPDDARPVTVGGSPAWISQGLTEQSHYWKLHQPPYEITVANFSEGKRDRHRLSFQFVAPKTGKRMSGFCADADGHIDRIGFLALAASLIRGLRAADG